MADRPKPRRRQELPGYTPWKPTVLPFFITFALVLAFSVWTFSPNTSWLGWTLSIVWSLPAVVATIGLQGVFLTRRRARRLPRRAVPQWPVVDDMLIVVVPTIGRHDTYPALERCIRSFVRYLPSYFPRFRVDVIIEEGCEAHDRIMVMARRHPAIRVVPVPHAYRTPRGTRFKARANHYSHVVRLTEREDRDDIWVLHMDDDTAVRADTGAAIAQFVNRQRRASADEAKHLAQGILTYPRENALNRFTWLADAVRPTDDVARFRALTGLGTPIAGVHGELLLIRSSIEARIGWDFGPNEITEDARLALQFCTRYPGKSDWFSGRCYGASPSTVRDFIRQRERWAWGLVALAFNREIPLRNRAFLGFCVLTWLLGPFQHLGFVLPLAYVTGYMNTSPVTLWITALWGINFAYAVWTYWEGLRINAHVSENGRRKWWEPVAVIVFLPLFSFIEGIGSFRGLLKFLRRRENQFVVIAKPA